jgi:DUF971 family protein
LQADDGFVTAGAVHLIGLRYDRRHPTRQRALTHHNYIMAGLDKDVPRPTEIKLHKKSREMELTFDNGSNFRLSFEFLRVYSPSAEVRGHGPGQETLQTGKREVDITALEPVGNYAVQPSFSDGHNSGIYSWDLLFRLGQNRDELWADYLVRLEAAKASRDVDSTTQPPKSGGSCGKH